MDLFAEFKVLDMGERLGRFISQYRVNYFKPDRVNGPIVYSYKLLPGAEERIYDKISDITISMKATDYLDMPELLSTEYRVYLDEDEREKYEEMKDELVLQLPGGEITAANAASLSGKLCQLSNGAIYDDDGSVNAFHERKLDALEDIIESANGKPAFKLVYDGDRKDMITILASVLIEVLAYEDNASILKGVSEEAYQVVLNILGKSDEEISVPMKVPEWLYPEAANTGKTFSAINTSTEFGAYGPLFTQEMAIYLADNLDDFIDNLIYLLGIPADALEGLGIHSSTDEYITSLKDLLNSDIAHRRHLGAGAHLVERLVTVLALTHLGLGVDQQHVGIAQDADVVV